MALLCRELPHQNWSLNLVRSEKICRTAGPRIFTCACSNSYIHWIRLHPVRLLALSIDSTLIRQPELWCLDVTDGYYYCAYDSADNIDVIIRGQ